MTLETVAVSGLLIGLCAYALLTVFFVYGLVRRITGRAALIAASITMAWFGVFLLLGSRPVTDMLEISAYAAWTLLLTRILGVGIEQLLNPAYRVQMSIAALTLLGYVIALVVLSLPLQFAALANSSVLKLFFCLIGIVTLEQVARNTRRDHEWNLKFLIIGLGIVYAYGFVLYADALLFKSVSFSLFAPQGFIYALATPFIAIASLRNRSQRMNVNLSRRFTFRTGTLLLAGGYLLIMGTAGYYVRFFGGEWGQVFQVFLVSAGLIGLAVIAASTQVRNAVRVAIVRNLYEYKYDYRDEWLRVTHELTQANADESLAHRSIHALSDLVHASSGAYWRLSSEGVLMPVLQIGVQQSNVPLSPAGSRSLLEFTTRLNWIIDLNEFRRAPETYAGLDLGLDLDHLKGARFIVPLTIEDRLFGIIAIGEPTTPLNLIWEDYDILKVVARQTAGFLALHYADSVLSASKQLRAMDQLSAFVMHDLKTVTAQLSLLLANAERHRSNPAFIDDMLKTTEHAVGRMTKLLDQLRSKDHPGTDSEWELVPIIEQVVHERSSQVPEPTLQPCASRVTITADRERLAAVLAHVVQNAQDATGADGNVRIAVDANPVWAIITVADTGHGMTQEFIDNELFAPFSTTKGVAGIGIGAYQCREYVRSLGGDVSVRSQQGIGTQFTLRLPRATIVADEVAP